VLSPRSRGRRFRCLVVVDKGGGFAVVGGDFVGEVAG
jgi:hypothetical protein